MKSGYAIVFLSASLAFSAIPGIGAQSDGSDDSLYRGFKNPPKDYDIIPLWTWNGKIDAKQARRQIDEMLVQGVRRAIVYPFPNLRIRFLSEDWWKLWGDLLAYARAKGFQLGVNAENEWPDGDARDEWLNPPDQSHVLEGHPEYHMKRLAYLEHEFVGPGPARFKNLPNPVIAVAARINGPEEIDGDSLVDVSNGISGSTFSSTLPEGNWRLMFFYLENTMGAAQGLRIDPLNPAAVSRFIDLTLGEYYRRFKDYFGNTFTFVLVDNEGDYGNYIGWTPSLFENFRMDKGYDLRKYLPLLVYEGGTRTPKVRIDYMRVISGLYRKNYWEQIARWCEGHGLQMTAQGWSESLQYDAAYGGDYMEMMRALPMPGVEALGNRGRSPREFVEDESIADFDGKRYWLEGPLVLGAHSYLSPQMERYSTNMLALWGMDLWSPQFYMDQDSLIFPPDVFISQPWWKYFRHYVDYVRRVSYMNGDSRHVADLLLYRPLDTTFAYSAPLFRSGRAMAPVARAAGTPDSTATPPSSTSMIHDSGYERGPFGMDYYPRVLWDDNFAATTEVAYFDLMELLTGYQRSYDVVDDHYLERMKLGRGTLNIAGMSFRGLLLPPMKVISRNALSRIRRFYEEGGLVIAYRQLPSASSEQGWADPGVAADIHAIFGVDPDVKANAENHNPQGGKAYFVAGNVEKVLKPIDDNMPPDMHIVEGTRNRLLYLHKVKKEHDVYWIVNDTDQHRNALVSLATEGKPEMWNPATGERRKVAYWMKSGRTVLPLELDAWDATYVVMSKDPKPGPSITATNLENYLIGQTADGGSEVTGRVPADVAQIYVEGEEAGKQFRVQEANRQRVEPQVLSPDGWSFKLDAKEVEVKYAREALVTAGYGLSAGFTDPNYNDKTWELTTLSAERATFRDWWVTGPFPNPNHGGGYNTVYAPERKVDLDASYEAANGSEVGWRRYHSTSPDINLTKALGSNPAAAFVGYAATWVYSPRQQQVRSIAVGENIKLWVNRQQVFARYTDPMYFELRDPFGHERNVELKVGWNEILVKVVGAERRGAGLFFYLRFADSRGLPVEGLITSWDPSDTEVARKDKEAKSRAEGFERWYRMEVPAGTNALILPPRPEFQAVYLNGRELRPNSGRVEFPELDFRQPPVLALKTDGHQELLDFVRFQTGQTSYHLGSWTRTGLTYYTGSATYEKGFELSSQFQGTKVVLDCGRVGVTVEIWLNGQKLATRLWEPFSFDVSDYLKPGKNQLKLVVTNSSDAATRAVPDFKRYLQLEELGQIYHFGYNPAPYLDVIDMNGLIGPIRLIPYQEVRLSTRAR